MFDRERNLTQQWIITDQPGMVPAYEEQMLKHNLPQGLLPMEVLIRTGKRRYRYCVTGYQSLDEVAGMVRLSGQMIEFLFREMFSIVEEGKRYLLQEENYCIMPESIFLNTTERKVLLCYLPGYRIPLNEQLKKLSEWILEYLDAEDSLAVYRGYGIHVLCKEERTSIAELLHLFRSDDEPGCEKTDEVNAAERERFHAEIGERADLCEPDAEGSRGCSEKIKRSKGRESVRKTGQKLLVFVMEGVLVFLMLFLIVYILP